MYHLSGLELLPWLEEKNFQFDKSATLRGHFVITMIRLTSIAVNLVGFYSMTMIVPNSKCLHRPHTIICLSGPMRKVAISQSFHTLLFLTLLCTWTIDGAKPTLILAWHKSSNISFWYWTIIAENINIPILGWRIFIFLNLYADTFDVQYKVCIYFINEQVDLLYSHMCNCDRLHANASDNIFFVNANVCLLQSESQKVMGFVLWFCAFYLVLLYLKRINFFGKLMLSVLTVCSSIIALTQTLLVIYSMTFSACIY